MTSASSPTGLVLDPNDPHDAQIIARQVKAARQAGRDGRDRAKSTRGRADLEAAYDEGAAEAAADQAQPTAAPSAKGGRGAQSTPARSSGGRSSKGDRSGSSASSWRALRPTSPARPPTRLQDVSGFLTGLALYTVVVTYIRYGPEGWRGWLSAKFLNKPLDPAGGIAKGSSTPTKKSGKAAAV